MSGAVDEALTHVRGLFERQISRIERIKSGVEPVDFNKLEKIKIGMIGGDGIGPAITDVACHVLETLLKDDKRITLVQIEGLTIENRAKALKAIPDDVLKQIKECDVVLKGPTTTPEEGDGWPNIESANVAMRKELDLFANIRPIRVPEHGIDWVFFRENTEGLYALGSDGLNLTDDIAFDFRVITTQGARRVLQTAFKYAAANHRPVSVVTKANVVKTTDGKFLSVAKEVAKQYPSVQWNSWYIDIMTAKLLDTVRRSSFGVFVMPNLYGDILTDEAAQIQGGVGTAGAANIGDRYAMFEAIHGSALRMVAEGRAQYADPSSMLRAAAMLLNHIGHTDLARKLDRALDICTLYERKVKVTGRANGVSGEEFGEYVAAKVAAADIDRQWESYIS